MSKIEGLIVILGSPNDEKGNLLDMGQARVQTGLLEYQKLVSRGWKILLTGGIAIPFNPTSTPNAQYAANILIAKGVPKGDIVEYALSDSTVDDAIKAKPIVDKYQVRSLVVVSSDFHIERVRYIFDRIFKNLKITYVEAPYINNCPLEEKESLLSHEQKRIQWLKNELLEEFINSARPSDEPTLNLIREIRTKI